MTAKPLKPIVLYVLHLNPEAKGLTDRFAVMRLDESGYLVPLWGAHIDADPGNDRAWAAAGREAAKAWPYMVFQRRPASGPDRYPAFHFALRGYGYSKLQELAESLAYAIRYPVELRSVTGWRSSPTAGTLRSYAKPVSRKAALAKLTGEG